MSDLVRIAYIVYSFQTGGLERCVAHLSNRLDRTRFQPIIICLEHSGSAAEWIEGGDVPIVEIGKNPRNDLGAIRRLAKVLRDRHVHIAHSHNWGTLVETALARRLASVPVHVHTEHGQGLHEGLRGPKQWLRSHARRWAFERASAVAVCAESVRQLIYEQCGFPQGRLLYLPNGVEAPTIGTEGSSTLRRQLGLNGNAFIVGSVGRLAAVKDFGNAIEAISLLAAQGRNVHLLLVGDGPDEPNLRELAKRLDVADRVHLVGRHENVGDWLGLFDLYVNCSRSEAMSMGILEAMAAGRPLVVTDAGDNAALVEGPPACGVVVRSQSGAVLASAMSEMLDHPGQRREFSGHARSRYQACYSVARMAEQHGELYGRLISDEKGQSVGATTAEPALTD